MGGLQKFLYPELSKFIKTKKHFADMGTKNFCEKIPEKENCFCLA